VIQRSGVRRVCLFSPLAQAPTGSVLRGARGYLETDDAESGVA
jgi:hypothetical protein